MRKIVDPLDVQLRERPIDQVLDRLCSQENCDGEPYDQMTDAAEYIRELEGQVESLKKVVAQAAELSYRISKRRT